MPPAAKKIQTLLNAAGAALAEGSAQVAGFADHETFRRALIRSLDEHPAFIDAVRAYHSQAALTPVTGMRGQTPRRIVPSGRVQAPRHDSPRGARAR